ncbi:MAG: NAD(P)/FAD-dependent oxidoreductase [Chloroflexales bacterium]|nr:NAD(P)/FAD-dependent oxidoreductase [Chloroflexales bacterium]
MARTVVVIGGGPAGIEAAAVAARAGARVTLVSEGPLGGRAGWDSLIPSKLWSSVAELIGELEGAGARGVAGLPTPSVEPGAVIARIREVAHAWSAQEAHRLDTLGVRIVTGVASFVAPNRLNVRDGNGQSLTMLEADAVLIATGSAPRFPAAMRPDGKRVLAPRFMSALSVLPPDLVMVGGGVTGSEFVSLFSRLGVRVTWLIGPSGVLPAIAPDAARELTLALATRGVDIRIGAPAERIEHAEDGVVVTTTDGAQARAALAFLAIGRTPDLARLDLAAAGLAASSDGTLSVNAYGQTAAPGIFAIGDAAGGPMLANRAMAQAWVAGRHAAGQTVAPYRPESVVHAVYADPEVAQVGQVADLSGSIQTVRVPFAAGLKAHLVGDAGGWVELAFEPASGLVRGAVAVGRHAADVLAPVALALQLGATVEQLGAVYGANPTITELAFIAARAALRPGEGSGS